MEPTIFPDTWLPLFFDFLGQILSWGPIAFLIVAVIAIFISRRLISEFRRSIGGSADDGPTYLED